MTREPAPASLVDILRRLATARGAPAGRGIAVDVGAHVGKFSKELIDSELFDEVVAFEPNAANVAALTALAAREPALTVVASAVGAEAGEREFHCDDDSSTGSLLPYGDYAAAGEVRHAKVTVTTLDAFRAEKRPRARIAFLKVDTQGYDLAVLQGAAATLASDRPPVVVEMIFMPLYAGQSQPFEIGALMRKLGYALHSLFNIHATVEGRLAFCDALFAPLEIEVPHSQHFVQLDRHESYLEQIRILEGICAERLRVIEVLDAEVKRLSAAREGAR